MTARILRNLLSLGIPQGLLHFRKNNRQLNTFPLTVVGRLDYLQKPPLSLVNYRHYFFRKRCPGFPFLGFVGGSVSGKPLPYQEPEPSVPLVCVNFLAPPEQDIVFVNLRCSHET